MKPGPLMDNEEHLSRSERIDLRLTLLSMCCIPGVPITLEDQQAWVEVVTRQRLQQIEARVLKRAALIWRERNPESWEEVKDSLNQFGSTGNNADDADYVPRICRVVSKACDKFFKSRGLEPDYDWKTVRTREKAAWKAKMKAGQE